MFLYPGVPDNGADNRIAASSASSATSNVVSTSSISTTFSLLQSDRTGSGSAQVGGLTNNVISQVSGTSIKNSTQMNTGGDSTLSTSIVPVNAFGYSSHADASSGGVSFQRPVQDSEPNIRLGAFKSISSSAASDNKKASANPGARPAATKGHPQSTGGISKGQYTYHSYRQSSEQHHAAQSTAFGSQNGSASSDQSAMPDARSASQSEGRPVKNTATDAVQDYEHPEADRPASPSGSSRDDQSLTAAGNLQSGSHSGEVSDTQHASEEQPQLNASEGNPSRSARIST